MSFCSLPGSASPRHPFSETLPFAKRPKTLPGFWDARLVAVASGRDSNKPRVDGFQLTRAIVIDKVFPELYGSAIVKKAAKKPADRSRWTDPAIIVALLASIAAIITCVLNIADRLWERNKMRESVDAQIQLAETNRQRDFLVWQEQQSHQFTNWMNERKIEWTNELDTWRQERSEERTHQLASIQAEQAKQRLAEKEQIYQDFEFYGHKFCKVLSQHAVDNWHLYCLDQKDAVVFNRKPSRDEIADATKSLHEQVLIWQHRVQDDTTELTEVEDKIARVMQRVGSTFSPPLQDPVGIARVEMDGVQIGIPYNRETDEFLHNTFRSDTNASYTLSAYYNTNLQKYANFDSFKKSWERVERMMDRELQLERLGIQVKPEFLTTTNPIIFTNGLMLTFKEEDFEKLALDDSTETDRNGKKASNKSNNTGP